MSVEHWVALVGTVAAVCTTVAFVPQIIRIRKQGGRDLSYGMLFLYLSGIVLWLAYGVLIEARAVILANAMATLLVSATLVLKRVIGDGPPGEGRKPGRRLRIAIDMDDVIADTMGKILRVCNETFATSIDRAELEGRSLAELVPSGRAAEIRDIVLDPDFFADLAEMEGSREVVRELAERYEVFIASAAMEVPTSFAAKYTWLRERFPFIPPSHLVFCGDKGILDADYLIDDTPRHFDSFRGTPVLFSSFHNRSEERFLRVEGWADVRRLLLGSGMATGPGDAAARTPAAPPTEAQAMAIASGRPRTISAKL